MPVVCVDIVELSHEHGLLYVSHIEDFKKMVLEGGAEKVVVFITEAGGGDEVVFLSRWPSVQARGAALEKIRTSHLADFLKYGKAIAHHSNFLCLPDPNCHPDKDHVFNKHIGLHFYNVKGDPFVAAKKFCEISNHMKGKFGMDFNILAVLHPIAFTGAVGLIVIVEEGPSGMDANLAKMVAGMNDASEAATMKSVYEHYVPLSTRICKPWDPAKFAAAIKEAGVTMP
jgi:hypothetical protein